VSADANSRRASARGQRARAILEDELVAEAFAVLERRAQETWAHSLPADSEGRERAYRELRALQALRAELEAWIRDGKVAERAL
jgi:hypothetical protein